jgi:hypothetical protein
MFQQSLEQQSASGGGDYPEAADRGVEAAVNLSWRTDDTARLLFWVADAPHHAGTEQLLVDAVRRAAQNDVHIYPVAASGTSPLAEYSRRSAAQLTLGRYLFLTDDSGIGNPHAEPTIPCYFVTRLDDAVLRMVDIEMSGVYHEPAPEEIIRTGGDPEDGTCELTNGDEAIVF